MSIESSGQFLQWPSLAWITFTAAAALIMWHRAGSLHAAWERLWRLCMGKAEVSDPVAKALLQETLDLEKLRFIFGLQVSTMVDLHRLATWMKSHHVSLSQLSRVRRWVDVASPRIICLPPENYFSRRVMAVFAVVVLQGLFSLLIPRQTAVLHIWPSGVWFKVRADVVRVETFWGHGAFDLADCRAEHPTQSYRAVGMDTADFDRICLAYRDGSLQALIRDDISWWRAVQLVGILLALTLQLALMVSASAAKDAERLWHRVHPDSARRLSEVV